MNRTYTLLDVLSLDDAVQSLFNYKEEAHILAGGTDLLVKIRKGGLAPRCVVSLHKLKELRRIEELPGGGIRIGALATLSQIADHPSVRVRYPALAEATRTVGSLQIQNVGTLAGNLCNASPAADTAPPLLIYEAHLNVFGPKGRRTVPIESFFIAPGKTDLDYGEIVESIDLPAEDPDAVSCYLKLGRTRGADLAIVGVAVQIGMSRNIKLAVASVAPTPLRLKKAELELSGDLLDPMRMERALGAIRDEIDPISDLRASRQYRSEMAVVLARRGIEKALTGASGSGEH